MKTPPPPIQIVAWCNTCLHHVTPGKPGQRCPVGDPDCHSVLTARRAMLCPIGICKDEEIAILAPANESARDLWRQHLLADHAGY